MKEYMFKGFYRVEFNESGLYDRNGIWNTIDEIAEINADSEEEAVDFAKEWYLDNSFDREEAEKEISEYAWRASEITVDEYGCKSYDDWKYI